MPRMPLEPLTELAARAPGRVRFLPRFVSDPEIPALLRRADVLALPYREIEQSGVLYAGLAFGKPMVLGDVGGFAEFGRRHDAARLVPPGDPAALADVLSELVANPAERERLAAAARAAVAGVRRLGRDRRAHAGALPPPPRRPPRSRQPIISPSMGLARKIFWGSVAGLVHTHVTYPLTLAAIARLRERRGTEPARPLSARGAAVRLADHRRLRRGGRDRRQGRRRPRPRLPARAARADRRLRRLRPTGRSSWPGRPAPTWSSTFRAAASWRPRTRRSSGRAARSSPSATPTRPGSRTRCARSSPPSTIPRSATPAGGSSSPTPTATTRRASTGATRWRSASSSRSSAGSPPATAASTRSAAPPTGSWRRRAATTSRSRSRCAGTAGARSTSRARGRARGWFPRSRASSPASGG